MDSHKLIRSGVANDAGKLRPTLQHCLEAALSIADSMIDELLAQLEAVADPDRRKRHRPLLSDEIPSPVRVLGDEPLLAPLQEVGPGHFVARHAVSGAF